MCRIVGGIDFNSSLFSEDILLKMCNSMSKGGPDGSGIYLDGNIGLGHRRLAILDLSDAASQPMEKGVWVISFNGEIYNFREVRDILLDYGVSFKSDSDTEVIIEAFNLWGKDAVSQFKGMFTFALYNKQSKILTLCRDRFGVKPLYYYLKDGVFLFSSEIKAFHEYPLFDKTLELNGISHFLQKGYFSVENCIFKYVHKVPPGSFIDVLPTGKLKFQKYWQVSNDYFSGIDHRTEQEILVDLKERLICSFKLRLVSDVEIGVYLSGGIDSSLVTAMLQKISDKPLRTFTMGFQNNEYNEGAIAFEVASVLGTNHETFYFDTEDLLKTITLLSDIYDEPFGDASAIPTFLLSKKVSKHVKVVLSGDGGDELFGGYSKYYFVKKFKWLLRIPILLRQIVYKGLLEVHPKKLSAILKIFSTAEYSQLNMKLYKFREVLIAKDIDDLFEKSSNYMSDKDVFLLTGKIGAKSNTINSFMDSHLISSLGTKDIKSYLSNDILTKVDRASMYVGLEAREPFLDPELLDFALSLPDNYKIDAKLGGKILLKKILGEYIDLKIVNGPKRGFTVPIVDWLNGALKNDVIEIGNEIEFFKTFELNNVFYKKLIFSFYKDEGKYNPYSIWFIYCLYNWYKKWL